VLEKDPQGTSPAPHLTQRRLSRRFYRPLVLVRRYTV
jgi:hypothetical protein